MKPEHSVSIPRQSGEPKILEDYTCSDASFETRVAVVETIDAGNSGAERPLPLALRECFADHGVEDSTAESCSGYFRDWFRTEIGEVAFQGLITTFMSGDCTAFGVAIRELSRGIIEKKWGPISAWTSEVCEGIRNEPISDYLLIHAFASDDDLESLGRFRGELILSQCVGQWLNAANFYSETRKHSAALRLTQLLRTYNHSTEALMVCEKIGAPSHPLLLTWAKDLQKSWHGIMPEATDDTMSPEQASEVRRRERRRQNALEEFCGICTILGHKDSIHDLWIGRKQFPVIV